MFDFSYSLTSALFYFSLKIFRRFISSSVSLFLALSSIFLSSVGPKSLLYAANPSVPTAVLTSLVYLFPVDKGHAFKVSVEVL